MGGKREQRTAVAVLVRRDDGRVLMQRRSMGNTFPAADGKWEFPGGKVDFGELPEAAALREVLEETGCVVRLTRILAALSHVWERHDHGYRHVVVVGYEARWVSGTPRLETGGASEIRWCTEKEIGVMDCLEGVAALLAASSRTALR